MINYSLISNDGGSNITVFSNGHMFAATDVHPNWDAIVRGAMANDPDVIELFDVGQTAQARFERLSDRVTVKNGTVYLDSEPVHNALTEQVVRFIRQGVEDFQPLINFFEKIESNPQDHSREQLFEWLDVHDFTILPNGNFVGYKGVRSVATTDGVKYESISHGTAISDGVEYDGAIPNPIGAVVEMPRSEVQHDPSVGCHTGLHVGTWSYAHDFARGAVLKVEVNPRDVVSVPTDCGFQKLRTCKYTVLEVIDAPVSDALDMDYDELPDSDEYDFEITYSGDVAGFFTHLADLSEEAVDTRKNHLRQKRDANGRFIPKSS
jgi:hypothetical protein